MNTSISIGTVNIWESHIISLLNVHIAMFKVTKYERHYKNYDDCCMVYILVCQNKTHNM